MMTNGKTDPEESLYCLLYTSKGGRNMANKLELTWYGKDEPIRVEPRLLIENTALSNTAADPDTQNMLIHGDNLLALKALESKFAGQVKCCLLYTSRCV